MAVSNQQIQIGAAQVNVGAWVTAGGAGTLVDIGHTREATAISFTFEDATLTGERVLGTIDTKAISQASTLLFSALEVKPEMWRICLRQPAANLSGAAILLVGDAVSQYHQITVVVTEKLPSPYVSLTITLWRCQFGGLENPALAKGDWTTLKPTVNVLRDDTVATLDKYMKFVWA